MSPFHPHSKERQRRSHVESWSLIFSAPLAAALLIGTVCLSSMTGRADDTREYQIKAACVYNFAKFIDWPPTSFTNATAPLVIGVIGKGVFLEELQKIALNHKINGRNIVAQPVERGQDARNVHILFFTAIESDRASELLETLKGSSVLTVGESGNFIAAGGMINFVREGDKVRFAINSAAADRVRLRMSAQLLKLAIPIASVH